MPQKKNPDVVEVIRSRMANILGNFLSCATAIRTLPSSYNLDLQETTPILWSSLDIVKKAIQMLSNLFPKLKINNEALNKPHFNLITSTELANILTRKYDIPFRTSYNIIGTLCRYMFENSLTVSNITPALLSKIIAEVSGHQLTIDVNDIKSALEPTNVVEAHAVIGGPAPIEAKRMLESRRQRRDALTNWLTIVKKKLAEADRQLKTSKIHYFPK
jgi:argininosuccinate lyase